MTEEKKEESAEKVKPDTKKKTTKKPSKSAAQKENSSSKDSAALTSYAVISSGGKQYTVCVGDVIEVERLSSEKGEFIEPGSEFVFDQVLAFRKDENSDLEIGSPFLKSKVGARVLAEVKDEKKFIFKKRRRKGFKKKIGHRQPLTRVQIESIGA